MKSSDFHLISSPNMNKSRNRKIQKTEIKLKSNSIARNVKKRKKKFHDSIESTMTSAFLQQLVINAGQTDSKKIFARDCWKRERERERVKKKKKKKTRTEFVCVCVHCSPWESQLVNWTSRGGRSTKRNDIHIPRETQDAFLERRLRDHLILINQRRNKLAFKQIELSACACVAENSRANCSFQLRINNAGSRYFRQLLKRRSRDIQNPLRLIEKTTLCETLLDRTPSANCFYASSTNFLLSSSSGRALGFAERFLSLSKKTHCKFRDQVDYFATIFFL